MRRRTFIAELGGAALWPMVAGVQQSGVAGDRVSCRQFVRIFARANPERPRDLEGRAPKRDATDLVAGSGLAAVGRRCLMAGRRRRWKGTKGSWARSAP